MASIISMSFLLFLYFNVEAQAQENIFDVMKFGAKANGKSDDSNAFSKAWEKACKYNGESGVLVPEGKYMVKPVLFEGPCRGPTEFQIKGTLVAPKDESSRLLDYWINFKHVDRLNINGGGSFDGKGRSAWPYNTCSRSLQHCKPLPTSIKFGFITNSRINNITSMNSKGFHMSLFECSNVTISNVKIDAPKHSPNTDGIHMEKSKDINIFDSKIATGDDCISMGPGSKTVNISNINCGPGHGISIGSLGRTPNEENVDSIMVKDCNFTSTTNGVRIKTWNLGSYSNTVFNLNFHNIHVDNVSNPIIITQNYCPRMECQRDSSNVKISDIVFNNVWGTTRTKVALNLQCSPTKPCEKIELRDIDIAFQGGASATSSCSNAYGQAYGRQNPPPCISSRPF